MWSGKNFHRMYGAIHLAYANWICPLTMDNILKKKVVRHMHEELDDLMVLEEGNSPEAVQACCTTSSAAVR